MKRIGFIVNSRVPDARCLFQGGLLPHHLALGWDDSASAMSVMRFRWIARELARQRFAHYELYKPWRSYDAVVFLKSMGPHCLALATRLQGSGTKVVFEANVDYYTQAEGEAQIDSMTPTATQRENATAITRQADAVIASSRHLAGICSQYARDVHWIPDNVNWDFVPTLQSASPVRDGRLQIWWSGMASKLFEFLVAEEAFLQFSDRLHFHFVTNSLEALSKWKPEIRQQFEKFLSRVSHTMHRFDSVGDLLNLYTAGGGIIVSPRYLDTPYNLGHTEWKITLGMASGLPALASPVPSYQDVAGRAEAGAIRLCKDSSDWHAALDDILSGRWNLSAGSAAARAVVRQHYATSVVAPAHWKVIQTVV